MKAACSSLHLPWRKYGLSLPSGRICALPQVFLPGHRFYSVKSSVYEKQNFSFSVKKTKRKPVDASGRRRLEGPAGRSPRKLEISSTAGRLEAKCFSWHQQRILT
jgi:hypothetical protein